MRRGEGFPSSSTLSSKLLQAATWIHLLSLFELFGLSGDGCWDLIVRETIVCDAWFAGYWGFLRNILSQDFCSWKPIESTEMFWSHLDADSSERHGLDIGQHHLLGHRHLGAMLWISISINICIYYCKMLFIQTCKNIQTWLIFKPCGLHWEQGGLQWPEKHQGEI